MAYFLIYSGGIIFQLLYNVTYGILRALWGFARRTHFPDDLRRPEHRAGLCVYLRLSYGCLRRGCRDRDRTGRFRHRQFPVSAAHFPGSAAETALSLRLEETGALLMRLSIPIMLQTGVNSIGFLILQRLINSFGAPSIEGYAAMLKVEQLAHIPSQSFNVAISSFAGQNIGAEKLDRARRGYRTTILMGVLISISISIVVLLFDRPLLQIFNITGESLRRAKEHLDILMFFIWTSTITNITCGFLQGAGDVKIPAASGFINLGIRLTLSFLLALTPVGFRCYYVSMPPAWLIACFVVVMRYRSGKWRGVSEL